MKRFVLLLIVMCVPLFLYSDWDIDKLNEEASKSFVEVIGIEKPKCWFDSGSQTYWSASGFFVSDKGYVVTCKSFLKNKKDFQIRWFDENNYTYCLDAMVVTEHPTENVAVLKVENPNNVGLPQCFLNFDPIKVGSWVFFSFQNTAKQENFPVLAKILCLFPHGKTNNEAIVAVPTFVGSMGCPILNLDGAIIGMQSAFFPNKQNFICCLPLFYLKEWLEELEAIEL